jgi:hypothetical protein
VDLEKEKPRKLRLNSLCFKLACEGGLSGWSATWLSRDRQPIVT